MIHYGAARTFQSLECNFQDGIPSDRRAEVVTSESLKFPGDKLEEKVAALLPCESSRESHERTDTAKILSVRKQRGGGGERREAVACAERYVLRSPARLPFVVGEIYFELKTSISADM